MLLWRICNIKEEQAILNNGLNKLTFGAPLRCYVDYGINYYPQFKAMMEKVRRLKGEERIKPILKMFPYLPKDIPLFEKDEEGQKEIMDKFVPHNQYKAHLSENVFFNSIKVAGFFDTCWKVPFIDQHSVYGNKKLITIDIPEKIALKYKGYGKYMGLVYPEYAIPLYLLKPEHLNLDNLSTEEYNKMFMESRDRGELIATKNIFKDKIPEVNSLS